jgi:DNA mismatch repair ATPase MutS
MCGFPTIQLQKHLKTLVQQNNRFVALCEEFARPVLPGAKPSFDRRVARIVTPGTLIDEPFLDHYDNNYLLAISSDASSSFTDSDDIGLAWIDVSTGEFFTKCTTAESLCGDIVRIRPREVVLPRNMESADLCPIRAIVHEECTVVSYFDVIPPVHLQSLAQQALASDDISVDTEHSTPSILSSQESSAVSLLTGYLQSNLLECMPSLSAPSKEADGAHMEIDAYTLKSLEIREGLQEGGATGTLLGCVRRTMTSGGTRLLSRWLCASPGHSRTLFKADGKLAGSPSTSLSEINARQSLVSFFHARPHLRRDLREPLRGIEDVTRTVQKFLLGRGNTSDVAAISMAMSTWSFMKSRILLERESQWKAGDSSSEREWAVINALISRIEELPSLRGKIQASMDDTPTGLESLPETSEGANIPRELLAEDRWQHGYRWSINPE